MQEGKPTGEMWDDKKRIKKNVRHEDHVNCYCFQADAITALPRELLPDINVINRRSSDLYVLSVKFTIKMVPKCYTTLNKLRSTIQACHLPLSSALKMGKWDCSCDRAEP